jgi:hypothetical protein
MRIFPAAAIATAVMGCSHPTSTLPAPASGVPAPEYDLYAIVILHQHTAVFTPDSTSPVVCLPGKSYDPCTFKGEGPPPEAWTAFIALNRTAVAIDSAELAKRGVKLVGAMTEEAWRVCPPGPAVVHLSRVGFNHDSTEAILESGLAAGKGPFEGCGYAAGQTSVFRRERGGPWKLVRILYATVS